MQRNMSRRSVILPSQDIIIIMFTCLFTGLYKPMLNLIWNILFELLHSMFSWQLFWVVISVSHVIINYYIIYMFFIVYLFSCNTYWEYLQNTCMFTLYIPRTLSVSLQSKYYFMYIFAWRSQCIFLLYQCDGPVCLQQSLKWFWMALRLYGLTWLFMF